MTDDSRISLNVVTPDKSVFDDVKVKEVSLTGPDGQITILPGHRNLVSTLETGEFRFKDESGEEHKAAISWGFMQLMNDNLQVLAETLERPEDIDVERARRALEKSQEMLVGKDLTPEHFRKYNLKLQRSVTRIGLHG
jgi:F-type H+-transporting ATPase subunit epsilon